MTISRKPYRSDLSDERWGLIEPILVEWRAGRVGLGISEPRHDLREIVNAILYVNRTGVQQDYLPHDFPPGKTVSWYFSLWEKEGVTERIHDALRGEGAEGGRPGSGAERGGRGLAVGEDLRQRSGGVAGDRRREEDQRPETSYRD
jgi:transposase